MRRESMSLPYMHLCLLSLVLLGLAYGRAHADDRYTFDKEHTSISFSVSRLGFFETESQFTAYDGHFVFSARHPDRDAITITLYPGSIHTSDEDTDKDLQGPDFFDAAQFPQMRFVSTAVTLIDQDNARITGNLTLLGVTKPVTLDAHFTEKEPGNADYIVGFTASGVIHRSDFGMDHLIPFIGDEVDLRIKVKGIEEKRPSRKG